MIVSEITIRAFKSAQFVLKERVLAVFILKDPRGCLSLLTHWDHLSILARSRMCELWPWHAFSWKWGHVLKGSLPFERLLRAEPAFPKISDSHQAVTELLFHSEGASGLRRGIRD